MKKLFLCATLAGALLSAGLAPRAAYAQTVPQGISYQAVARNAAGAVLANQPVKLRLSVSPNAAGTLPVYVETQAATTSALGLLTVTLGQGTLVSGAFATISWGTGSYWVKTEIDPAGGVAFQILGTTQLLSVPYALYAKASATSGPTGAGYGGTSVSIVALSAGAKTFVTQAGLAYVVGQRVRVAATATQYLEGVITAYTATSLTLSADRVVGAGTLASWKIGVAGEVGATGAAGTLYKGTSASSVAIGAGAKTFVTQAGLSYVPGTRVRVSNSPTAYLEGVVTAYAGTSLTLTADKTVGVGTLASWTLNLAGELGLTGPAGAGYGGTSATSTTLSTGLKTFVTQVGKAYVVGQRVRASASATQYVEGVVTAYAGTSLTLSADRAAG
ncbi:MAG: hypothetical protein H7330_05640, partial [Hymenobacteraceae bacterium]|nr:hypothetical protein [Hymenobacteraceae bacterium]